MRSNPSFLRLLLVSVLAIPAAFAAAGPDPAKDPAATPTFGDTIDINVVNVDVFVTDRAGKPVSGLKKGDFQLFEDGKSVDVTNFQELRSAEAAPAGTATLEAAPQPKPEDAPPSAAPETDNYLAIYFDDANIEPSHRARVLKQVKDYLANHVRLNDKVMISSYNLGLHVESPFTSDRTELARALQAIEARTAGGGEISRSRTLAIRTMLDLQAVEAKLGEPCDSTVKSPVESFAQEARQAAVRSLQGMTLLVNSLAGVPGRKILLLVSDGIPLNPGEEVNEAFIQMCGGGAAHSGIQLGDAPMIDARGDPGQVYLAPVTPLDTQKYSVVNELDALTAHANASRVAFYTLQSTGAASLASSAAGMDGDEALLRLPEIELTYTANYQGVLSGLASATGGRTIFNANQIEGDLAAVWSDMSSHYSLGFSPTRQPDGKRHKIDVKVKTAGLRVRTFQNYRDKPVLERTFDHTLATLLYGIESNPLEVSLDVDPAISGDKDLYSVPLKFRVPLFKLGIVNQDGKFVGRLRLFVASQSPDGTMSPIRQVQVPLNIPEKEVLRAMGQYFAYNLTLQLKPGPQRVALTIRDDVTGVASFLSRKVVVGPPAGAAGDAAARAAAQ